LFQSSFKGPGNIFRSISTSARAKGSQELLSSLNVLREWETLDSLKIWMIPVADDWYPYFYVCRILFTDGFNYWSNIFLALVYPLLHWTSAINNEHYIEWILPNQFIMKVG
jgi:hypothetical protein